MLEQLPNLCLTQVLDLSRQMISLANLEGGRALDAGCRSVVEALGDYGCTLEELAAKELTAHGAEERSGSAHSTPIPLVSHPENRKTVLIVDDDRDLLKYLSLLFQEKGFQTLTACDGHEATEMAIAKHPDLITLDISMPGKSGVSTYRDLQADPELRDIPVILISAIKGSLGPFLDTCRQQNGPVSLVDKPVDRELLWKSVETALSKTNANTTSRAESGPVDSDASFNPLHTLHSHSPESHAPQRSRWPAETRPGGQVHRRIDSLRRLTRSLAFSHEIKRLLATLNGGVYIVNRGLRTEDQDQLTEGWGIVQRSIDQMRSFLLQLLYYADEQQLRFTTIDATRFAEGLLSEIEYRADALGVELHRSLDPTVGTFEGDEHALRLAILNLLDSALLAQHGEERRNPHRVSLQVSQTCNDVVFAVLDNGPGNRLQCSDDLSAFLRSTDTMEPADLGLFISNRIARQHGGSLDTSSALDVGSSCTLRIPRRQKAERHCAPPWPPPAAAAAD